MRQALLVFFGSGVGGLARYALGLWASRVWGPQFPWGTVAINATGSFWIAVVIQLAWAGRLGPDARLALATGLLGGFTTYSSFNQETLTLYQQAGAGAAALNLGLTVLGCLVCGALGLTLGRAVAPG